MLKTILDLAGDASSSLRRAMILNLCVMGVQQASYVAAFFLLQTLYLSREGGQSDWIVWVIVLVALALAYSFLNLRSLVSAYTGSYAIGASLRLRLCDHLRRLSLAFFKKTDSGIVSGALIDDIKSMEVFFGMYLFDLLACLVFPCLLCVLMLFFSWQITSVLVLSAALAFPLILWACRITVRLGPAYLEARDSSYASLMDYVGGIRELKAVNLTGLDYTPLVASWKRYGLLSIRMEGQYGLLALAYSCILDMGFLATLVLGLSLVENLTASIASLMFFLVAGSRFVEPMREFGMVLPEVRRCLTAAQKISDILAVPEPQVLPEEKRFGHEIRRADHLLPVEVIFVVTVDVGEQVSYVQHAFYVIEGIFIYGYPRIAVVDYGRYDFLIRSIDVDARNVQSGCHHIFGILLAETYHALHYLFLIGLVIFIFHIRPVGIGFRFFLFRFPACPTGYLYKDESKRIEHFLDEQYRRRILARKIQRVAQSHSRHYLAEQRQQASQYK